MLCLHHRRAGPQTLSRTRRKPDPPLCEGLALSRKYSGQLSPYSPGKSVPAISDCDLMIFKGNISCYILLLKYPPTLENTKFIAGELSLIVSLVLYLPTGHYEP